MRWLPLPRGGAGGPLAGGRGRLLCLSARGGGRWSARARSRCQTPMAVCPELRVRVRRTCQDASREAAP